MSYHKFKVAVIGAGAAGLCAASHVLSRSENFHPPVVYEMSDCVGGTWVYTDNVGRNDYGLPVHSSMYKNLRSNLPKEIMGFPDFPFDTQLPSFVSHNDVRSYLEQYTDQFGIRSHIKFCTNVELVNPISGANGDTKNLWEIISKDLRRGTHCTERFDSVLVCTGHYSDPYIPHIPGIEHFKGQTMHSHEFRITEPFTGKNVILLGCGPSGIDMALELCSVAKQVVLSHANSLLTAPLPPNILQAKAVERFSETGVICGDKTEYPADIFIFCTGYNYSFPFLSREVGLEVRDHRVTPLYKHIVHTTFPTLFFIGLCKTICPFPFFHIQISFALAALDGTHKLPSKAEMDAATEDQYQTSLQIGIPHRHFHKLDSLQWSYSAELAQLAKVDPLPPTIRKLYEENKVIRRQDVCNYKNYKYEVIDHEKWRIVKPKSL
ncbi:flavin-containing monooxygenase FMO GS-OX-like 4 [Callorhinchus milii]|uniref:Flavin-containing monooxygenase n=1 Tax=Callorhinchus milii TaxID=7868 RepID=V9KWT1_CALMI|nr:flavin-containing monooxygenase FMO GS-OX-like 4 [Callorhinchus milii]|eukprot:gi/632944518/ref/XP_007887552.1/ PREDICTED: flavin-containing monooxygenase FMO GS-OX-like 4 [Callorhinchus milii]